MYLNAYVKVLIQDSRRVISSRAILFPFTYMAPYLYEKVSAGAMLLLVMIDTPWVSFIVSSFGIARRI